MWVLLDMDEVMMTTLFGGSLVVSNATRFIIHTMPFICNGSMLRKAWMIGRSIMKVKSQDESVLCCKDNKFSQGGILKVKTQKESCKLVYGAPSKSNSDDNSTNTCSSVDFDIVTIRRYARTIGDSIPSNGAPMSIDWNYLPQHEVLHIDEYEEDHSYRRDLAELFMQPAIRHQLLFEEWGCSFRSILAATKKTEKVRCQRNQSAKQSNPSINVMQLAKKTYKKLKKVSNREKKQLNSLDEKRIDQIHIHQPMTENTVNSHPKTEQMNMKQVTFDSIQNGYYETSDKGLYSTVA